MKRAIVVLCALSIAAAGCGSGNETVTDCYSILRYKKNVQPAFDLYVMNVRAGMGTRVDLYVQMQYGHLRFLKTDAGYGAAYAMVFTIRDEDDEIIQSKDVSRSLTVGSYDQTVSLNADAFLQSFTLPPGTYTLQCSAVDQNSLVRYTDRTELTVIDLAPGSRKASTMLLLLKPKSDEKGVVLRPLFPQTPWYAQDSIGVFQELYDLRQGDTVVCVLQYRRQSEAERFAGFSDVTMSPPYAMAALPCPRTLDSTAFMMKTVMEVSKSGLVPFVHYYPIPPLGYSRLELSIRVVNGTRVDTATSTLTLFRPRSLSATAEDIVEAMRYISRPDEFDSLRAVGGSELASAIGRFWDDRGGEARRSEFEGRVQEANKLFSACIEGSRTPMGITYIVCGPPDAVECRSPFSETWFYTVGTQTMAVPFHIDRRNNNALYYELPTYSVNDALWRTFIDRWRRR